MDDAGLPAPWVVQAPTTTTVVPVMTQTPAVINVPVSVLPTTAHTGHPQPTPSWSPPYPGSTRRSKHGQPKKFRRQMEFKAMQMHCPGDENIIPIYRPEDSDPEPKVTSPLNIGQLEFNTTQPDLAAAPKPEKSSEDIDIIELRAENERHYKFMKDLEETTDWLSDDEYEEPEMNPKYS